MRVGVLVDGAEEVRDRPNYAEESAVTGAREFLTNG